MSVNDLLLQHAPVNFSDRLQVIEDYSEHTVW